MIFKSSNKITINGRLWLESNGKRFFGPGPVELLERIDATGSISKAAKEMKMSYKKASELVTTLNGQLDKPLVLTQTGGTKGGGSVISEEAREIIKYYRLLRARFESFLRNESKKIKK